MEWYWIVGLTLCTVWIVSVIIAQFDEDYALLWAMGLLYPLLYVLLYPARAVNNYRRYRALYEKHGITMIQYVFGKRIRSR